MPGYDVFSERWQAFGVVTRRHAAADIALEVMVVVCSWHAISGVTKEKHA